MTPDILQPQLLKQSMLEGTQPSRLQAFDSQHDIDRMVKLQAFMATNPEQAQREIQQLLTMVDMNVDTFVLELCGVEVFESFSKLDEQGRLVDVASGLDLVEMTQKAKTVAKKVGNNEDYGRVEAEGEQMQLLYQEARSGRLKPGDTIVEPSPRGVNSVFKHNFVDFITVLPNGQLHLVRRHSQLAQDQMMTVSSELHQQATGTELLKERLVKVLKSVLTQVPRGKTLNELFGLYGTIGASMTRKQAQAVIAILPEVKTMYKEDLQKVPPPKDRLDGHVRSLVGIVNTAIKHLKDQPASQTPSEDSFDWHIKERHDSVDLLPLPTRWEIESYRRQSFAGIDLPCGRLDVRSFDLYRGSVIEVIGRLDYFDRLPTQGLTNLPLYTGLDLLNLLNPYSQSAESLSQEKILPCTCPFCQKKVDAKIANGKISCPNCKKSVDYKC